jgi:serine/threonine-protein kinase
VSVKYAATPAPAAPGIAVLFRPANAESKYIATEFSRNFIHSLGRLPGLTVAPRGAVLKWENASAAADDAGKALGVPVIFFGTVQQSAETFRLEAELINVRSGAPLWRKTFQDPLAAAPGAQVQIVRMIATTLGIELSEANRAEMRRPLTTDPEAWLHYLHARQHNETLSEAKLLQAVGELELALAKDPEFAEAYAALANAHLDLGYTYRNPAVHLSKAKAYVAEALKRDETLVEAIIVKGAVSYFFDWDWAAAERAVKQAVLLDPSALENHACYLHSLETTGRAGEAIAAVRLASAHYPSSIAIQSELGCSTYYAGKFQDAAVYSNQVRKNDPQNPYLDWGFARALAQLGRYEEAIDVLTAAQRKPDGDWTAILSELAYVRGRENRRDDALLAIQQLRARSKTEFVDPYLFAMAYAGIGDKDEVFRNLELAASVRSSWIPSLPVEPKFAALRMEPRFQQVLATLKLPASR